MEDAKQGTTVFEITIIVMSAHIFLLILFLPRNRWQLHFIKSEFKGQLPDKFEKDANGKPKPSAFVNDGNLEEPSRYVSLVRMCTMRTFFIE